MSVWNLDRMVAFDTETTGLNVETDRIVTASIVTVEPDCQPTINSFLTNPGVEIPEAATAVHGITTEHAREHGGNPATVLHDVVCLLAMNLAAGMPLVGMNLVYDLTILDRECRRHGVPLLGERIALELGTILDIPPVGPVIDVWVIDKAVDRYRPGKRKLVDLCAHYGVAMDQAHDATSDAVAAARLAWKMHRCATAIAETLGRLYAGRKHPDELVRAWQALGAMTLGELHDAQVGWYAQQTESFAQYLRQQANEARHRADLADTDEARDIALAEATELDTRVDGMSGAWPLTPFGGAS